MSLKVREEWRQKGLLDAEPVVRGRWDEKFPIVTETGSESKTQQHFKDSCDINKIVSNPEAAGSVARGREMYGDFTTVFDFAENMQKMKDAELAFSHLPTEIKKRFHQSPQKFFDYMNDKSMVDEHVKFGFREVSGVESIAPQATKSGKLKKTTTVVEESSDE